MNRQRLWVNFTAPFGPDGNAISSLKAVPEDMETAMGWGEDVRAHFPDWGTEAALARWPQNRARLRIGDWVNGLVIARAPFGVWLDIDADHPALLLVRR